MRFKKVDNEKIDQHNIIDLLNKINIKKILMNKLLSILAIKLKNGLSNFIPIYNKDFFQDINNMANEAAKSIVPIIYSSFNPKSVVDIGCGTGYWLKYFKELGVKNVLGIDGEYIPKDMLEISINEFYAHDLKEEISLNKKYDLAISIEVAEHLNKRHATTFVKSLTNLSDLIIFSAAIPKQGGTHHVNERWPKYWQNIFKKFDYEAFDAIRPQLLWRDDINEIYKQNIFIFVNNKSNNYKHYSRLYPKPTNMLIIQKEVFFRHKPLPLRLAFLYRKYISKTEQTS